jgi:hypothetical protein
VTVSASCCSTVTDAVVGCWWGVRRYVEGIKEELTAPTEWVHSLTDQKVYLIPNGTIEGSSLNESSTIVVAQLERIIAVVGTQEQPVRGVTVSGFKLRHSASHYTGPYPTCGGGDFCAARTGAVFVSGAENVTLNDLDLDHPGGNGIALIDYNRDITVSGCSLRHVAEVAFVVQGVTDGIDATGGKYPIGTRITRNFVYEVATKMRGGSFFFQSMSAQTELDHNVALNGPRAGVNFKCVPLCHRLCRLTLSLALSFCFSVCRSLSCP